MKKIIILIWLTILTCSVTWSARMITNFDVARWYLDSDLVIICNVNKIDTLAISSYDSLYVNNERIKYDIIQESYYVTIDSIIRNSEKERLTINQIFSQSFRINYLHTKELERNFSHIDSKGDSIYTCSVELYMDNYDDYSYFRLELENKYLVILSETNDGFVIDYKSEYNENLIEMINEIELKGESYFLSKQE